MPVHQSICYFAIFGGFHAANALLVRQMIYIIFMLFRCVQYRQLACASGINYLKFGTFWYYVGISTLVIVAHIISIFLSDKQIP